MPECPELHLASQFVNIVCKGRIFKGPVIKSEVSKLAEVDFNGEYTISAASRGKEIKLTLVPYGNGKKSANKRKPLDIVFQFGMSGRFDFDKVAEMRKHAHLNFFTKDEPRMVLSYVDPRRFGKWQVGGDWSTKRGPCVLFEYDEFRRNVLENVKNPAFNKPICECLLNQKYFNGVGNYLRSEILFRAGIPPFVSARSVLEPLTNGVTKSGVKVKKESPDVLELCHTVPQEVVNLKGGGYDPWGRDKNFAIFIGWLQCYNKPEMKNMGDHNKRTVFYCGDPGPMVPKDIQVRGVKRFPKQANVSSKKMKKDLESSSESSEEEEEEEEVLTKGKKEDEGSKAKPKLARSSTKSKSTRPSKKPKQGRSSGKMSSALSSKSAKSPAKKGQRPDRGSARSARKK